MWPVPSYKTFGLALPKAVHEVSPPMSLASFPTMLLSLPSFQPPLLLEHTQLPPQPGRLFAEAAWVWSNALLETGLASSCLVEVSTLFRKAFTLSSSLPLSVLTWILITTRQVHLLLPFFSKGRDSGGRPVFPQCWCRHL